MRKNWYLEWEAVIYDPGCLSAKGFVNGKEVLETVVRTTGAPCSIQLIPDRIIMKSDGEDVAAITVRILDEMGNVVPYADNQLIFEIAGEGSFLGCGNGNPGSHESDQIPVKRAFHGLCQVLIRSGFTSGKISVMAKAEGLKSASCVISVCELRS